MLRRHACQARLERVLEDRLARVPVLHDAVRERAADAHAVDPMAECVCADTVLGFRARLLAAQDADRGWHHELGAVLARKARLGACRADVDDDRGDLV